MKISETLRQAQTTLWDGVCWNAYCNNGNTDQFICIAIKRACSPDGDMEKFKGNYRDLPAVQFLAGLGMPLNGGGFTKWNDDEFIDAPGNEIEDDAERQSLRYAWLELAIQVAEEEGL